MRAQHVVDERQAFLRVGRIAQQHHAFYPYRRAFSRNAVEQVTAIASRLRRALSLKHPARPTQHHADVAIGQVRDELRRIEIANVRPHLEQQGFGLAIVFRVLAVVGQAQVMQGNGHDLVGCIEHGHAALAQFGDVVFLEDQVPGIDRRIGTQYRLDLFGIVSNAGGAPHIGRSIAIAGVVALQLGEDLRVQVGQVGQLRGVEFLEYAGLDQVRQQVAAGEHHVITTAPGHEFALHDVTVVEHVIYRVNAQFLLEFFRRIGGDVVIPVVDMHAGGGTFRRLGAGNG
ncbi:hypothetical protein D3C76_748180 [compost metagenome]